MWHFFSSFRMPIYCFINLVTGKIHIVHYSEATVILIRKKKGRVFLNSCWPGGQHSFHWFGCPVLGRWWPPFASGSMSLFSVSLFCSATVLWPGQPHPGVHSPVPDLLQAIRPAAGPRWVAEGSRYVFSARPRARFLCSSRHDPRLTSEHIPTGVRRAAFWQAFVFSGLEGWCVIKVSHGLLHRAWVSS